jgi:hypothetical protein
MKTTMTHKMRRGTNVAASALIVAVSSVGLTCGASNADPAGHQVTYTVTALLNQHTGVFFMANQPPSESAYADNDQLYLFSMRPIVNPDKPWSYTTKLANPERWAFIRVGDWYSFQDAYLPPDVAELDRQRGYTCQIAVDGRVVATGHGQSNGQAECGTKPIVHPKPDIGPFPKSEHPPSMTH